MVGRIKSIVLCVVLIAVCTPIVGCGPNRVPQYEPKSTDKRLSPEEAQAQRENSAAKMAADKEAVFKRYGIDPNTRPPLPDMPAKK